MINLASSLENLKVAGNLRSIPADSTGEADVIDFSTNDYLGLAERTEFQEEFMADMRNRMAPMTSSASRLLASRQNDYHNLETTLESLYPGRKVLLMGSGYHANTGMISAIARAGRILILADKLVHASIIDGIMLGKSDFSRFPHNDFDRLEAMLAKKAADYPDGVLVVVESVYSMDGDCADIDRLIDIKRKYPSVILYVDEAHALGVYGPRGLGLVMASKAPEEVDVTVGTFGKALASAGAFVAARDEIISWAVNSARSFIFSTALPPMTARWTQFMIEKMLDMDAEREHLKQNGRVLYEDGRHIAPVIIGDASRTVGISKMLLDEGFKVLPIRTPTVPPGTERLRISLSAAHSTESVRDLSTAIKRLLS